MKVAIDEAAWTANDNIETFFRVGSDPAQAYRFMLPNRTDVITCLVTDSGTKLDLQPDRSEAHKSLKVAFGI